MTRRPHTTADVAWVMPIAADAVADGHAAAAPAASFAMRAAAPPRSPTDGAKPMRLRLSRAKGFDLQRLSIETNGLPATAVARPSHWGNPFRVAPAYRDDFCNLPEITPERAVGMFRERWQGMLERWPSAREGLAQLRGQNLACWCGLCPAHAAGKPLDFACAACAPCHVDVFGELLCEALDDKKAASRVLDAIEHNGVPANRAQRRVK